MPHSVNGPAQRGRPPKRRAIPPRFGRQIVIAYLTRLPPNSRRSPTAPTSQARPPEPPPSTCRRSAFRLSSLAAARAPASSESAPWISTDLQRLPPHQQPARRPPDKQLLQPLPPPSLAASRARRRSTNSSPPSPTTPAGLQRRRPSPQSGSSAPNQFQQNLCCCGLKAHLAPWSRNRILSIPTLIFKRANLHPAP
jgi:hypothetical protein